jgi:hypothetical protein
MRENILSQFAGNGNGSAEIADAAMVGEKGVFYAAAFMVIYPHAGA